MKVLFVCYANVGRSQVAQAYFTTLSQHASDSAGIAVNELIVQRNLPSRKLKDVLDQRSVGYIGREFGVDVSERERQQLVPAMLDEADRVIVIAEKERWPGYLQEGGKSCSGTFQTQRGSRMILPMMCSGRCNAGWSA